MSDFKCGSVSIVGKPNVGKSSLINAIIKEKVSIVSPKPQTTRNNIVGIYNDEDSQIVFVDTPGIFNSDSHLGSFMNKSVNAISHDTDVVVVMIDGSKNDLESQLPLVKKFKDDDNVILVISKTDLTTFEKLYPELAKCNEVGFVKDIIPISSHKNRNIDVLINSIKKLLPIRDREDAMFETDIYTTKSVKFIASEIIREKMLWLLQDEIPHGVAVYISDWIDEGTLIQINADIICEKDNHKQIIIGKGGKMLKDIGTRARIDIENMLDVKVNLKLFVKVKNNWKNNLSILDQIGYNNSEEI